MSVDVASPMARLLLAPVAGAAFLSFKTQLYLISSLSIAYRLMPYTPLILIDMKGDHNPLKRTHGVAELLLTDSAKAVIRLLVDNTATTIEITADDLSRPTADWIYGAFVDQWIATEAEIEIFDASQAVFELYLPPREGASGKIVTIEWDGGKLRVEVPRDSIVRHPPIRLEGGRHRIRVSVDAHENHGNSTDARFLGVLVGGVILDNERTAAWVHEGVAPLGSRRIRSAAAL